MAKFHVGVMTVYEFEIDSDKPEDAKFLVEDGEMPRNHEVVGVWVQDVERLEP
jgi:hypothetical protein